MSASPLGVYVHFPFCLGRCPYCDFVTTVPSRIPHREYADAVLAELAYRLSRKDWSGREILTVYFGGGTPSLWAPRELGRVLDKIVGSMPMRAGAEVTVEVNPGQRESAALSDLRAVGVNRLSFGTQSFLEANLRALGRRHSEADSLTAVERARRAGFDEVSIDLIYALPGQDSIGAAMDARKAAATGADHISAYCLTIHPGTPMERELKAGRLAVPDEDTAVQIEDAMLAVLSEAGFLRYEVSNFAREGKLAVHNTGYWSGREYLGLGAGAHGFRLERGDGSGLFGGTRYHDAASSSGYLARVFGGEDPSEEIERLDSFALLFERMFLGLRMTRGVDLDELHGWSGIDPAVVYREAIQRLVDQGLVEREGPSLRPTERGLRFNDSLALELG